MNNIQRLQNYLKEDKLEGFLVLTKINRQYLSGFTGSAGMLLITLTPALSRSGRGGVKGELFVDDRYLIRAKKESWLPVSPLAKLATSPALRASSPPDSAKATTGRRQGRRIGIEDRITLREAARLEQDFPKAKWVATQDIIEDLRAVKSPQEIRNIKKGSEIIDATFRHIVKLLKTSPQPSPRKVWGTLTEIDVTQEIERFGKKLGADGLAFDPIVAWGPNAAAPHHFSSNQKIRRGNFLLLDFGFLVKGYHSDFTRTLFIGNPSKKQEKVYNTVLEAQKRAIERIRSLPSPFMRGERGGSRPHEADKEGVKASLIDQTARGYISSQGFGKYFTHNTGHGVGLEIHELPNFSAKSEDILRVGMVVTVEPGIYIEKWGGVRIEDMVLVKDKSIVLSRIPKDLRSIIIR